MASGIRIRDYEEADAAAICRLFYETVREVNLGDYSPEQVRAWVPEAPDPAAWHARMSGQHTLVAEEEGGIVGFAELEDDGHLDMLFEIDAWNEKPYDEREGTKLARVVKTFRGDVEGESTTDLLLAYGAEEGSAACVGFEGVVGRGSFVLHHSATGSRGERSAAWSVVPDTGDLLGLSGVAEISVDGDGTHSFTLVYELD